MYRTFGDVLATKIIHSINLVLLTHEINAGQSQDWCHCCNGVKCIFVIKYHFNLCKIFIQGVLKVTYQYTGIISIINRNIFLKHPVYTF